MSQTNPLERINYAGDLAELIADIAQTFRVGEVRNFEPILTGYEDLNIKLTAETGKFLVKILASERKPKDIARYADIINAATTAGVNHPEPLVSPQGGIIYRHAGLCIMVFRFIEGKTFFELGRSPNTDERQAIIQQVVKINAIGYRPPFYDDSWSVTNIRKMFTKVEQFLDTDDKHLLVEVLQHYNNVPLDLPHCFVHGDIITTNVVKANNGKLYILDFSVANWYPRIQELAVMASSLLSGQSLQKRCQLVIDDYEKFTKLEPIEKQCLYSYALAAAGMELIGAYHERHFEANNSTENDHWLELGRQELREELGQPG